MFQYGGGKYVGQWGTRDVRIEWKGEEDWENRIKSAYWQSKSYDKQIAEQEAKDDNKKQRESKTVKKSTKKTITNNAFQSRRKIRF